LFPTNDISKPYQNYGNDIIGTTPNAVNLRISDDGSMKKGGWNEKPIQALHPRLLLWKWRLKD